MSDGVSVRCLGDFLSPSPRIGMMSGQAEVQDQAQAQAEDGLLAALRQTRVVCFCRLLFSHNFGLL
jgi:hypothetical protein